MLDTLLFAKSGDTESLKRVIVANPISLHDVNEANSNALHLAAANGNTETVEYLLNSGIDVNSANCEGLTALHLAVRWSKKDVLEILLRCRGVDLNVQTHRMMTALHYACKWNRTEIAFQLLRCGSDSSLPNDTGKLAVDMIKNHQSFKTDFQNVVSKQMTQPFIMKRIRSQENLLSRHNSFDNLSKRDHELHSAREDFNRRIDQITIS